MTSSSFGNFISYVRNFSEFGKETQYDEIPTSVGLLPFYVNEFWTSKQRDAHSLHEVSYRACFKPQLPRFFIEHLTEVGDVVFDPFMGRGTTLIEAALMGRKIIGNDINPLSISINTPRLTPPDIDEISQRLDSVDLSWDQEIDDELLVFYHEDTLRELHALRSYLNEKDDLDDIDKWIQMVAINRLTGHSNGFFSVYTLPPNQAVSIKSQIRINEQRGQQPEYRDIRSRILKKSRSLLRDLNSVDKRKLRNASESAIWLNEQANELKTVQDNSVSLVVTSPPFLDVVDYTQDNWLRCWFLGIDSSKVPIWQLRKIEDWEEAMYRTFLELKRVLKKGGYIAFEVGEVRNGSIKLEENVVRCAEKANLIAHFVLINVQEFTKTAACWGVDNLKKGTNSNRIVILQKT